MAHYRNFLRDDCRTDVAATAGVTGCDFGHHDVGACRGYSDATCAQRILSGVGVDGTGGNVDVSCSTRLWAGPSHCTLVYPCYREDVIGLGVRPAFNRCDASYGCSVHHGAVSEHCVPNRSEY